MNLKKIVLKNYKLILKYFNLFFMNFLCLKITNLLILNLKISKTTLKNILINSKEIYLVMNNFDQD